MVYSWLDTKGTVHIFVTFSNNFDKKYLALKITEIEEHILIFNVFKYLYQAYIASC